MAAAETCCCGDRGTTLIFACSGSSNVGQITHLAALHLARQGTGNMSCLAGVGAHISGFVVSAKDCRTLVVLDGCSHRCAGKTFEHHGIRPAVHVCLTDLGFEKSHDVAVTGADVDRAVRLAVDRIASR